MKGLRHQQAHCIIQTSCLLLQLPTNHTSRWLLAVAQSSAAQLLKLAQLPLNRELLILAPVPPPEPHLGLRLLEAFRVAPNSHMRVLHFADWLVGHHLHPHPPPLERRRADFRGATLNVSIKNDPPYAIRNIMNGTLYFSGYFYDTWHLLSEQLNFTYRMWEQTSWGSLSEAGEWSGMTGDLTRGVADAAIASFTQTTMRNQHVDFTMPLIRTRSAVFIRERYETEPNLRWLTSIFSAPLWFAIGAMAMLDIVSYVVVGYLHQKFACQERAASIPRILHDCSFTIFGVFCSQGTAAAPAGACERCVVVASLAGVMTVQAAFGAALVARLAVKTPVLPFSGLQGFLTDRTYQLAVVADSAELTNFEYAADNVRRALYLQLIAPNKDILPHGNIEGLQRVCSNAKYAFIAKHETSMLYSKSLSCALSEIPEASTPYYLGIGLQKGSPYRKIINDK
ncbi:glutamate receptor ionotropic, kainate 5-like [Schistocerca serialis cubense]|uniref:glutamate receptor ionotropic, kainate 5-like n=1 Tax=Schistocerca serialis cubense TaxID=2023355 RepID=UPI00214ED060|nr:glutamate receptor ionotropic, kainate 5-like [Schistocerca serialis cubense]